MSKQNDAAPETRKEGKRPAAAASGLPSADQVAGFLRHHPEFLQENPDLLDHLEAPDRGNGQGVVDFQHAVVQRLRAEVTDLNGLRDRLIETGRENLSNQDRVHRCVLALLEARSFEQFIERVTTDIALLLDVDLVTLGVERTGATFPSHPAPGIYCLKSGYVAARFASGSRIMLNSQVTADPEMFGAAANLVRSEALIRLSIADDCPPALLALGSRQEDFFERNQGAELLTFLARVIELSFRGWLDLTTN